MFGDTKTLRNWVGVKNLLKEYRPRPLVITEIWAGMAILSKSFFFGDFMCDALHILIRITSQRQKKMQEPIDENH